MRKLVWPVRRLATLFFEGTQCGRVPDPQIVPALWADPLGPMMKIWPICVLALVGLAILDDR